MIDALHWYIADEGEEVNRPLNIDAYQKNIDTLSSPLLYLQSFY